MIAIIINKSKIKTLAITIVRVFLELLSEVAGALLLVGALLPLPESAEILPGALLPNPFVELLPEPLIDEFCGESVLAPVGTCSLELPP